MPGPRGESKKRLQEIQQAIEEGKLLDLLRDRLPSIEEVCG